MVASVPVVLADKNNRACCNKLPMHSEAPFSLNPKLSARLPRMKVNEFRSSVHLACLCRFRIPKLVHQQAIYQLRDEKYWPRPRVFVRRTKWWDILCLRLSTDHFLLFLAVRPIWSCKPVPRSRSWIRLKSLAPWVVLWDSRGAETGRDNQTVTQIAGYYSLRTYFRGKIRQEGGYVPLHRPPSMRLSLAILRHLFCPVEKTSNSSESQKPPRSCACSLGLSPFLLLR